MSNGILNGQIFDRIASQVGAMPKIWGKWFPLMVENRIVTHNMHMLSSVFGYTDAKQCFPELVHDERLEKANKLALGFYQSVSDKT
jgi:hypothetical protein